MKRLERIKKDMKSNNKITATLEITVPTGFAVEAADHLMKRLERIKKDMTNRGMINSTIIVLTTTLPEEKKK